MEIREIHVSTQFTVFLTSQESFLTNVRAVITSRRSSNHHPHSPARLELQLFSVLFASLHFCLLLTPDQNLHCFLFFALRLRLLGKLTFLLPSTLLALFRSMICSNRASIANASACGQKEDVNKRESKASVGGVDVLKMICPGTVEEKAPRSRRWS